MRNLVNMSTLWLIIVALVECSEMKLQNNNDKIMNEIQHLTNAVVSRHFSKARCIGVITEIPGIYLVETTVPVFYITHDRNNNKFDSLMLTVINSGCLAFVLQVHDIKWMIEKFTELFRSPASVNRVNRRYIYLPTLTDEGISHKAIMNDVFTCKSMNWMPDLLIVNLLADQGALGNMDFLKQIDGNREYSDTYGKTNVLDISKELDFVLEIYTHKFVGENPSETVLLDVWVPDQGFVYGVDFFPDKVKNLMGKQLKTMSISYMPFTVMIIDTEPPVLDGIEFQALFEFGRKHNITWKVQHDFENWWGDVWNNGSGNGIIGAMAEDRTDFSFSAIYMIHRVFFYIDYSMAFYQSGLTAVAPKPKMLPAWLIPALPFTSLVWYAVLISVGFIILVLYIVSKSSDLLLGGGIAGRYSTLLECSFRTTGMLALQVPGDEVVCIGSPYIPMRHLVAWVVLYFLLIASSYAGGLSAILTLPQFQPPIDTIKDLADSGLQWYGTDVAYLFHIQSTTDPILRKVIDNFVMRTEAEIIKLAHEDDSALLVERLKGGYFVHLKYLSEEIMQNKRLMKESVVDGHTIIGICKGSPYKETFNSLLFKLLQSGIPQYWEGETARKYLSQSVLLSILQSRDPPSSHHVKLTVSHIQGSLILLALGVLVATIVFLLEHVTFYFTEKKKRERD